jgi:hypothetical protein
MAERIRRLAGLGRPVIASFSAEAKSSEWAARSRQPSESASVTILSSDSINSDRWIGDPRRTLLRDELERQTSHRLAAMYWQAIRAMDDPLNEERIPVAGYLLRELQKALPKHLPAAPQAKSRLTLGNFFTWVEGQWPRLLRNSSCAGNDGRWSGDIDNALARFLWELGERVTRYRADNPRWESFQREVLGQLDPALSAVPELTQAAVVKLWLDLHDFFNAAAHHATIDEATFEERVRVFEDLLGDRLIPRTFEKRDRIAELVKEIETGANG